MRFYGTLFCLIVCLTSFRPVAAQSEAVRAAMQTFVDKGDVSGVVTVIGNKDGLVDVQVLGLADAENKIPMRRDTIFRIASMTKPITALAVMQLVEQGKVKLDEPVECLLNGGTLNGRRIIGEQTLADMTTIHTADLKAGFVEGSGWGYGFGIVKEPKDVTERLSPGTYGHGGAYGTQAWIDPTKGVYTILLLQRVGLPNSDGSAMRKALHAAAAELQK